MQQVGERVRRPPRRSASSVTAVAVLVAALPVPLLLPDFRVATMLVLLLYMGLALSWNLGSGYTAYPSFGHHAFFGIGAYAAAVVGQSLGGPWTLYAPFVGGVVAALVALPLGIVLLRIRGVYFAIATLALGEIVRAVAFNWRSVTGGVEGLVILTPLQIEREYYLVLSVVVVMGLCTWLLERSPVGLRVLATRDDEEGAEATGINTTLVRVVLFVVSAFFAGALGGAYLDHLAHLTPNAVLAPRLTLIALLLVVAGGMGSLAGSLIGSLVVGGVLVTIGVEALRVQEMVIGLILMLLALRLPNGVVRRLPRGYGSLVRVVPLSVRRFHADASDRRPPASAGAHPSGGGEASL